ncbi:MAG: response regulator [Anaerolineae bacterium]|nr:response regulator [Anaerolineae bacterium]
MSYKVFLVEDEIVTREGIRDNVNWRAADFEFCGEAPDGEIALPLIEESKPDVLITDIKMPFMDGLQLSRIVREQMPWVKIIILSGHDEFEYAQTAVKLGVTEYLLKPVSAQDLRTVLENLTITLDREKQQRESLMRLQNRVADTLTLDREKFLLRLVMGGVSSAEAVEQSQKLGLDIVARYYVVIVIHIELCEEVQSFDYYEYKKVEDIVANLVDNHLDVFFTKKGIEEFVLLIKGNTPEQLRYTEDRFASLLKQIVEEKTTCRLTIGSGQPQNRIGDIHRSFTEALVKVRGQLGESSLTPLGAENDLSDLIKVNHVAIENYLKFGLIADYDVFFATHIQPICEVALRSALVKHYMFLDIVLTVTQFVSDLGGNEAQGTLGVHKIESILARSGSIGQAREEIRNIFVAAFTFRNSQANYERSIILNQAKAYIDTHFTDPELQMSKVANRFNLSPGYFSTVFRDEIGETFRDYLSQIRIDRAKELLRTTNLRCLEVAYQCGYNDSHYFSFTFKRKTGLTPQQFRAQSQENYEIE